MKITCKCGAVLDGPEAPFYAAPFLEVHKACVKGGAKERKIKRYTLVQCFEFCDMEEAPAGEYVRWDDVKEYTK